MSMSGIGFDTTCKKVVDEFNDVRDKRDIVILKINNNKSIGNCEYMSVEDDHEIDEVVENIKCHKEDPHWACFDLDADLNERKTNKRVLLSYCPDTLGVKAKMTHASTHLTVKKAIGAQVEVKLSSEEELDIDTVKRLCAEEVAKSSTAKVAIKHSKKK